MSIMDAFRNLVNPNGQPVVAAPVVPATGPGQIPTGAAPGGTPAAGTGDVPANAGGTPVAANADAKSPMDQFSDLWKNVKVAGAGEKPALFNLDPAKLLEAAKTIPFASAVTPEQLAAIGAGGEGAQKAFAEAMQAVAATTMMHSAVTTGNMVQTAVEKARTDWMKEVPGLVKGQNLRESVLTENPALSHPSTQPIVNLLQSQLQVKHPNASTAELRVMMSAYFDGLAGVIAKPEQQRNQASKPAGEDWSNFLE